MATENTYYADQLKSIEYSKQTTYPFQVKFTNGEDGQTKWMQLNEDSAKAIMDFLTRRFPNAIPNNTNL